MNLIAWQNQRTEGSWWGWCFPCPFSTRGPLIYPHTINGGRNVCTRCSTPILWDCAAPCCTSCRPVPCSRSWESIPTTPALIDAQHQLHNDFNYRHLCNAAQITIHTVPFPESRTRNIVRTISYITGSWWPCQQLIQCLIGFDFELLGDESGHRFIHWHKSHNSQCPRQSWQKGIWAKGRITRLSSNFWPEIHSYISLTLVCADSDFDFVKRESHKVEPP